MSAFSTSETRVPYSPTASVARRTTSNTSSHSPSISVNIDVVRFGRPDSRTILTAAATASCTEPSLRPVPLVATENATSMLSPPRREVASRDCGRRIPSSSSLPQAPDAAHEQGDEESDLHREEEHERGIRDEEPAVPIGVDDLREERDGGGERSRHGESRRPVDEAEDDRRGEPGGELGGADLVGEHQYHDEAERERRHEHAERRTAPRRPGADERD